MSIIPNSSYGNQEIDIQIDLKLIAQELAKDPAFIAAISKEVRNQMTKDVRWMGNLFAKWAQTQPPAPTTRKRAQ
jgi:hypothetical protein